MEPEGLFPSSYEPATGPYPGPYKPRLTFPTYLFKIHFNIIFPALQTFRLKFYTNFSSPKRTTDAFSHSTLWSYIYGR
jgi:hypothetical protein